MVFHDLSLLISMETEKRASQAKDEFLASMSHELRTPLTSIIGNSELLMQAYSESYGDEAHIQLIASIEAAGRNQLSLVNDILDISKIEAGKFTIDHAPYNLSELLDEIEQMFQPRARDVDNSLSIGQRGEQTHYLLGDAQRIRQILINLLSNAIKFTPAGEVSLTVWNDADTLYFKVKDSGIGMPPEIVSRLFQRFEQADGSISRRFGGSGLGLYISQSLAHLMEGEVTVESEEGSGSTFTLKLPYLVSAEALHSTNSVSTDTESSNRAGEAPKLQGTVLIAEDTPELQLLTSRILHSFGLSVVVASNGVEVVDLAKQQEFDLILMDMQMPEMDGIEATQRLRTMGSRTPIVPLTANVMQKHRDAFLAEGCNEFLTKPIDKQELRRILGKYLMPAEIEKPQRLSPAQLQKGAEEEVDDELMALFVESNSERKSGLLTALSSSDWDSVRGLAHAIKGSAASFGYPQLSEQAALLQSAIDNGELDAVKGMTMDLIVELGSALS